MLNENFQKGDIVVYCPNFKYESEIRGSMGKVIKITKIDKKMIRSITIRWLKKGQIKSGKYTYSTRDRCVRHIYKRDTRCERCPFKISQMINRKCPTFLRGDK